MKMCCQSILMLFSERLIGLPESMQKNHNHPQLVPALESVFVEDIAAGSEHMMALSSTGDVYTWGCNSEGQVLYIANQFIKKKVSEIHYCLFLLVWLFNISYLHFQLGLGHSNPVKEPTLVTALQGKNIRQISAGRCHSAAWTTPSPAARAQGQT